MDRHSSERLEFVAELVKGRRYNPYRDRAAEEEARKEHAASQLGMTRRDYNALVAEQERHIANARKLEDRLIAGINWLGFTAWSECDEARRDRLHDPARYAKIENIWIATLRQYEWALRELEIRGIPYRSQSLEGVADPHPLFEILEQEFDLTAADDDAILRIGVYS